MALELSNFHLCETLEKKPHWYLGSLECTVQEGLQTSRYRAQSSRYKPATPFACIYFPKPVLKPTCWKHLPSAGLPNPGVDARYAGSASTHSDSFQFLGGKRRLASAHGFPRPAVPKPPSSLGIRPGSLPQETGVAQPDLKGNVRCPRYNWGWCHKENTHMRTNDWPS